MWPQFDMGCTVKMSLLHNCTLSEPCQCISGAILLALFLASSAQQWVNLEMSLLLTMSILHIIKTTIKSYSKGPVPNQLNRATSTNHLNYHAAMNYIVLQLMSTGITLTMSCASCTKL